MATTREGVFAGLNAEWTLVCADPLHSALVRDCLEKAGIFQPGEADEYLDSLLVELEHRDRHLGREHSDLWLHALLTVAGGVGAEAQMAARFVVQAMLPGAFRLTRRLLRERRDFDEVGQVVVASMYGVVRSYPLGRQRKVAANVLLETLHRASRELKADCEPQGVAWHSVLEMLPADLDVAEEACRSAFLQQTASGPLDGDSEASTGPRAELMELVLWGVSEGLMGAHRAQVIAEEVRVGGWEQAKEAGTSEAAWRKRRSRIVQQLRLIAQIWVRAA
ncbi:hypothetical protein [Streptomyces sp. NPDC048508]|uniref:hypothetical protein n=1 Tax=Streptomyces sp. NPDC048508 TaxID=3365561 RepID=UPI003724419F